MRWSFAVLVGGAAGVHHNIRAELAAFNDKLNALKAESVVLAESKKTLLKAGEESLKNWEKAEHRSEKVAVAALRRNDIAFDEVEQQMEKRLHIF